MTNDTIDQAAVEQFESNFRHIYQQQTSRLMRAVDVQPLEGLSHYFEKIGAATAQAEPTDATRQTGVTPNIDPGHSKRLCQPTASEWGTMSPRTDVLKMLINPNSAYVKQGTRAIRRDQDDKIIAAFNATELDIDISGDKSTDQTTSVAFPAGNVVDTGDTTNGMTLAKWLDAKEILDANEVDDEGRFIVIGSHQLRNLLGDTTLTSADYNTVKALVAGDINSFLGMEVIRSERLPTSGAGATRFRNCFAWHRDAMGLCENEDLFIRVGEDPNARFQIRTYVYSLCNAARIWEEGVVQIDCSDPA